MVEMGFKFASILFAAAILAACGPLSHVPDNHKTSSTPTADGSNPAITPTTRVNPTGWGKRVGVLAYRRLGSKLAFRYGAKRLGGLDEVDDA